MGFYWRNRKVLQVLPVDDPVWDVCYLPGDPPQIVVQYGGGEVATYDIVNDE